MQHPSTRLGEIAEARRLARNGEAKHIRESSKTSTVEMAEEVGVHHSTIVRWEAGTAMPKGEAALRWLQVLRDLNSLVDAA